MPRLGRIGIAIGIGGYAGGCGPLRSSDQLYRRALILRLVLGSRSNPWAQTIKHTEESWKMWSNCFWHFGGTLFSSRHRLWLWLRHRHRIEARPRPRPSNSHWGLPDRVHRIFHCFFALCLGWLRRLRIANKSNGACAMPKWKFPQFQTHSINVSRKTCRKNINKQNAERKASQHPKDL